jgi:hypothetical protein
METSGGRHKEKTVRPTPLGDNGADAAGYGHTAKKAGLSLILTPAAL